MADHVLRLFIDRFEAGASLDHRLPATNRCVFVARGMATIRAEGATATMCAQSALFAIGEIDVRAGADGAVILRYELVGVPEAEHGIAMGDGILSEILQDAAIDLADPDGYLMRCDRVSLPDGGIAYTHTHQGPGIRCLLDGAFTIESAGHKITVRPEEAWFESGPDPVLAYAPPDKPATFARVMILPRRLKGQSSIRYVNPEDADKPKLQKYTIFIDDFIDV